MATLVINSLQGEYLPAPPPSLPPTTTASDKEAALVKLAEDALSNALAKGGSSSLETSRTLVQAEAALTATTRSLQGLTDGGENSEDPIAKQLLERKRLQTQALEKLKRGAPSVAAQKNALAIGRQRLQEQLTILSDTERAGSTAAKERARIRDELLVEMTAIVDRLEAAADNATAPLQDAHFQKNERKREISQRSLEVCDARTEELDEPEFMDAVDGATLQAEKERDEAKAAEAEKQADNAKLQQQLQQLQQAAAQAAAQQQQEQQALQQQLQQQQAAQQQQQQLQQQQAQPLAAPQVPEWWTAFQQEEARIAAAGPTTADLPNSYPQPQQDVLQTLHVAWQVLEIAQFQHDRLLTFAEVGLSVTQCSELMGMAWAKLYSTHPVPLVLPRTVASLLFRALQQLATALANRSEEDKGLVSEAAKLVLLNPEAKRIRLAPC